MVDLQQPCAVPLASSREDRRLRALAEMEILDTAPEESFDRITRLARLVMNTPIVTIALIDRDRQWFKSSIGLAICDTSRQISFCTHTIARSTPLIVTDSLLDPSFRTNPLVIGPPNIRFYMGVPLATFDGLNVGTLCIMDRVPRQPLPDQVAVMQDLAGLVVDELELRRLADTDGLTKARTRRSFLRDGRRALAQASRSDSPLSCLVVDFDHFKSVNDRFGHEVGDVALQAVAATCQGSLRSMDLFGRIGGEEFAVLLPDTSVEDAVVTAERLRQEIEALAVQVQAGSIGITASIGVSSRNGREAKVETLLAEADVALYEAKRAGRNRVVVANGNRMRYVPTTGETPAA